MFSLMIITVDMIVTELDGKSVMILKRTKRKRFNVLFQCYWRHQNREIKSTLKTLKIYDTKYPRMGQVKFVEDSL